LYIVWRGEAAALSKGGQHSLRGLRGKRRKEFELAGRALPQAGKPIPKPPNGGMTIEAAVTDFLEFTKNKKRPNNL
jgi:hypothetical protein